MNSEVENLPAKSELEAEAAEATVATVKQGVKFNDTFTTDEGDITSSLDESDRQSSEAHARDAKLKATPAIIKRNQATRHLVVQSPTDNIFSPISQRLMRKRKDANKPEQDSFN